MCGESRMHGAAWGKIRKHGKRQDYLSRFTAYGKSTGVKILASILHTPLLWMTCATTTEVEDFLSRHVPVTAPERPAETLPSFEDLANDPVYAYERLTGKRKENATGEEALRAYASYCVKSARSANPFKIVESDFVRALVNGYIVEVRATRS